MQSEIAAVIEAGEAVGLARPALERALRERLELVPDVAVTPGSLVFAESADGKYYVAEVISAASDSVRVRFKRGSEHTVTPEQAAACRVPARRTGDGGLAMVGTVEMHSGLVRRREATGEPQ